MACLFPLHPSFGPIEARLLLLHRRFVKQALGRLLLGDFSDFIGGDLRREEAKGHFWGSSARVCVGAKNFDGGMKLWANFSGNSKSVCVCVCACVWVGAWVLENAKAAKIFVGNVCSCILGLCGYQQKPWWREEAMGKVVKKS